MSRFVTNLCAEIYKTMLHSFWSHCCWIIMNYTVFCCGYKCYETILMITRQRKLDMKQLQNFRGNVKYSRVLSIEYNTWLICNSVVCRKCSSSSFSVLSVETKLTEAMRLVSGVFSSAIFCVWDLIFSFFLYLFYYCFEFLPVLSF